jgi:hypothetical protein
VAAAVTALSAPALSCTIGVDETRTRRVRWLLGETGWRQLDPWMTSIVELAPGSTAGIIGLTAGRTGASVQTWLELQSTQFRDAIEVVAIDRPRPAPLGSAGPFPAPGSWWTISTW